MHTKRHPCLPFRSLCKEGGEEASLLCNCVFGGEFGLLKRLLRAGAHVDQGDYDLRTALHIAAGEGRPAAGLSSQGAWPWGLCNRAKASNATGGAERRPLGCLAQLAGWPVLAGMTAKRAACPPCARS